MSNDARKRRGRPHKLTARDYFDESLTLAMDVELLALADTRRYGAQARAIRAVAKRLAAAETPAAANIERAIARVKKALQRRRDLAHTLATFHASTSAAADELRRRLRGVPDDVREALLDWPLRRLLDCLRRHHVGENGIAPRKFLLEVRSGELLSPNRG